VTLRFARVVQEHLRDAFPGIRVFRSSDAESIPTGSVQFTEITDALGQARFVLCLVSPEATQRPWVAFEMGFAAARGVTFRLYLIRGAQPAMLESPFSQFMARSIDSAAVQGLFREIEETFNTHRVVDNPTALLRALERAEVENPPTVFRLLSNLKGWATASPGLEFRLLYEGLRPAELQSVKISIPADLRDRNWLPPSMPGHLTRISHSPANQRPLANA